MLCLASGNAEETRRIGQSLARRLPCRGVVLLIGDLGAGKTTLAKGIIEALGVANGDEVTSPTYTIVHEYGDPVRVYHIDLYRLDTVAEVRALGFDDLLESEAILLVEWGERFRDLMPQEHIEIQLRTIDENARTISITNISKR